METKIKWQRARTPEQQDKRREEILQAAYTLFRDMDFETISLNSIAREANLSKTSVYLYFKTREEIFIHIYMESFREWISNSVKAIEKLSVPSSAHEIANAWVNATWYDDRMCSLAPLVNASIERNVSDDLLADIVWMKIKESLKLQSALRRFIPAFSDRDAYELLLFTLNLFSQFIANERNQNLLRVLKGEVFSAMDIHIRELLVNGVARLISSYMSYKIN